MIGRVYEGFGIRQSTSRELSYSTFIWKFVSGHKPPYLAREIVNADLGAAAAKWRSVRVSFVESACSERAL